MRGGIEILDWESEKVEKILISRSDDILKMPTFYKNNYIIYVSSYSGIENIYAYNLKNKTRSRITSRPVAAINPVVYDDTLYFNDIAYNIEGIAKLDLKQTQWQSLSQIKRFVIDDVTPVQKKLGAFNLVDAFHEDTSLSQVKRPLKSFPKFNPFAFHSFTTGLFFQRLNNSDLDHLYTLSLIGDDDFYTKSYFALSLNKDFSIRESLAEISYSGFYPIINTSFYYYDYYPYRRYRIESSLTLPFLFFNSFSSSSLSLNVPLFYQNVQQYNENSVLDSGETTVSGFRPSYSWSQYGKSLALYGEYLTTLTANSSSALISSDFHFNSRIMSRKDLLSIKLGASHILSENEFILPHTFLNRVSIFGDQTFAFLANLFNFAAAFNIDYTTSPMPIDVNLTPTTWPILLHFYLKSLKARLFYNAGYIKNISSLQWSEFSSNEGRFVYTLQSYGVNLFFVLHGVGQNTSPFYFGISLYRILDNHDDPNNQNLNFAFYLNGNF